MVVLFQSSPEGYVRHLVIFAWIQLGLDDHQFQDVDSRATFNVNQVNGRYRDGPEVQYARQQLLIINSFLSLSLFDNSSRRSASSRTKKVLNDCHA